MSFKPESEKQSKANFAKESAERVDRAMEKSDGDFDGLTTNERRRVGNLLIGDANREDAANKPSKYVDELNTYVPIEVFQHAALQVVKGSPPKTALPKLMGSDQRNLLNLRYYFRLAGSI